MAHAHDHASHRHAAHDHCAASHVPGAGQNHAARARKLRWAFVLTAAMMLAEIGGGWWSGSLALLADAGHMLVDTLALLLALVGARMALRPADARRSYGYGRIEVLAGFVNGLTQFVLVGVIVYEALHRLREPVPILSGGMLVVALFGLAVNALVLRTLHGHDHDDLNLAGASLHVLGDLLGSVAAVVAALLVRWLGWNAADPLLSLLVSVILLGSAWQLLRRSTHILLEGVPDGMDPAEVERAARGAHPAIRDVHHLHVWQLASGSRMATLHVELASAQPGAPVLAAIHALLAERFGIQHVTVQVDEEHCADRMHGVPCGEPPHG